MDDLEEQAQSNERLFDVGVKYVSSNIKLKKHSSRGKYITRFNPSVAKPPSWSACFGL